jgi:hypothetical protein
MTKLLGAVVLVGVVACDKAEMTPDAAAESNGIVPEMACTGFAELAARWWSRELPYIEPKMEPRFFVDGTDFQPLWGEGDPQTDGTTLVWAPRVYHFEDGSEQLGTAGRRGDVDSAMCVWVTPVRVEQ